MNNIRKNPAGDFPKIHPSAVIDPSSQIIGNVLIEENVFIGPLTVIRADERGGDGMVQPIIISPDVNIQDVVIIHSHIILRATLLAHCYVPPVSVIRNSAGAMGMHCVNVKERRYMEDALTAAVRLRDDYRSAGGHSRSVAAPDSTEKGG